MESNWRLNVALEGWVASGMELCAGLLNATPFFQFVYKNAPGASPKSAGSTVIFPDGSQQIATAHIDTPLNFPYGLEVFPD